MESLNFQQKPKEPAHEELPVNEVVAANDEFFSTSELALRALADEYIKRSFALKRFEKKVEEARAEVIENKEGEDILFPNSVKFERAKLNDEIGRVRGEIEAMAKDTATDTGAYFKKVEELLK
jgi:hypothetical protein